MALNGVTVNCITYTYRIYSNRGRPQIEAYSNKSRIFRASNSDLNDLFFENSSKLGHLDQY